MKVLFVAFELPPLGTAGVHRSLKFLKYLPEYGITPIALTTDAQTYRERQFAPFDDSLTAELSQEVVVERISCPRPYVKNGNRIANWGKLFFSLVEEHSREWEPHLTRELPRIIERYKPEAIYVTLPPFGMGPLWAKLAKRYQLPLVVDFRDNWSQWGMTPFPTWVHYRAVKRLERNCLESAARVICATEGVRRDLLAMHPEIPEAKITTITNGYDSEVSEWPAELRHDPSKQEVVIGYLGNFYYSPQAREALTSPRWRKRPHRMLHHSPRKEDWLYRSPYFFFHAVNTLLLKRPEFRKRLKIRFACVKPDWLDEQIEEFGLSNIVECFGYVEHKEVPRFLDKCDLLLATSAKIIGGVDYCIASKTFDYFVAKRPILGFVTEGTQKDTLTNTGMALICDPDHSHSSAKILEDWIDGKTKLVPNASFLSTFHRRDLTGQLAKAILSLKGARLAN